MKNNKEGSLTEIITKYEGYSDGSLNHFERGQWYQASFVYNG